MTKEPGKTNDEPIDLMSLDTIKASNEGAEVELLHPVSKKPLGQFIKILGPESDALREIINDRSNDNIKKQLNLVRAGKDRDFKSAEEVEEEGLQLLAQCTVGFRNLNFGGKQAVFSTKVAYDIYKSLPWVKAQINAAMYDISNFMKA